LESNTLLRILRLIGVTSKSSSSAKYSILASRDISLGGAINTPSSDKELVEKYKEEGEPVVRGTKSSKRGKTALIGGDFIADTIFINSNKKDPIRRTLIRHDPLKLAEALYRLI
jgi:hypothetical protein